MELLDDLIEDARTVSLSTNPDTELGRFDRGVFERGISVNHAARVLVVAGHWETATSPVRQLYEIVLNMEHVNTYPDRELAAIRFIRFGSMQEARAILANLEYESDRGRTEHLRQIADAAAPNILSEAEAAFYTRPQVRSTACSVLTARVITPARGSRCVSG